jgi:hypothetical protein
LNKHRGGYGLDEVGQAFKKSLLRGHKCAHAQI